MCSLGTFLQVLPDCSTNLERETTLTDWQPLPTVDNLWSLSAGKFWVACSAQVVDSAIWVLHAMLTEVVNKLC